VYATQRADLLLYTMLLWTALTCRNLRYLVIYTHLYIVCRKKKTLYIYRSKWHWAWDWEWWLRFKMKSKNINHRLLKVLVVLLILLLKLKWLTTWRNVGIISFCPLNWNLRLYPRLQIQMCLVCSDSIHIPALLMLMSQHNTATVTIKSKTPPLVFWKHQDHDIVPTTAVAFFFDFPNLLRFAILYTQCRFCISFCF